MLHRPWLTRRHRLYGSTACLPSPDQRPSADLHRHGADGLDRHPSGTQLHSRRCAGCDARCPQRCAHSAAGGRYAASNRARNSNACRPPSLAATSPHRLTAGCIAHTNFIACPSPVCRCHRFTCPSAPPSRCCPSPSRQTAFLPRLPPPEQSACTQRHGSSGAPGAAPSARADSWADRRQDCGWTGTSPPFQLRG